MFGDELMYVGDMIMGRTRDAVLDEGMISRESSLVEYIRTTQYKTI